MKKRILVTGGAGYVGRTLIRELYIENDVCVIDRLDFGLNRLSGQDLSSISLKKIDISNKHDVAKVIADFQPDVIVHLAAIHFIPACEADPNSALTTNVLGTVNLLSACPAGCRFVFASSGAVYSPAEVLHSEQSEIGPSDVYGLSKLHGEHYVRYFSKLRNFPAVIVRLFNVVGPGETNPHLLPEIVAQMKAGRSSVKLGNLWPKRDYIHVQDAAAGFAAASLKGEVHDECVTVNLGTSKQWSVDEIIGRLRAASGAPFKVEQDASRIRKVDRPFLGADIGEICRLFGWTPDRTIDDAVADLWKNPDLSYELSVRYDLDQPDSQSV